MKIKLKHDVYNISTRIKSIDKGYYVVFNTITQKFEIHNSYQLGSTYCLTLPYLELDERVLKYVCKTKSENIEKILEQIENNNKQKESDEKTKSLSEVCENLVQEKK